MQRKMPRGGSWIMDSNLDLLKMRKVFIVEDEPVLRDTLSGIFRDSGFKSVFVAGSVAEALGVYGENLPDIALLDVNLPDGDGFSLMPQLKSIKDVPVIFLTARDDPDDIVAGFEGGGDDYITKPFIPKELVARTIALLRRCYREDGRIVQLDGAAVDFSRAEVVKGGERIPLTGKEHDILLMLYNNAGRVISLDRLCEAVWGDNRYGYENSLMAHIRHIREKIENDPSHPVSLITVKGLGYKLKI